MGQLGKSDISLEFHSKAATYFGICRNADLWKLDGISAAAMTKLFLILLIRAKLYRSYVLNLDIITFSISFFCGEVESLCSEGRSVSAIRDSRLRSHYPSISDLCHQWPPFHWKWVTSSLTAASEGIENKEHDHEKIRLSFKKGVTRVCLQTEAPTVFGKLLLRNVCTYFSGNEGVENHILCLSLSHTQTDTLATHLSTHIHTNSHILTQSHTHTHPTHIPTHKRMHFLINNSPRQTRESQS